MILTLWNRDMRERKIIIWNLTHNSLSLREGHTTRYQGWISSSSFDRRE